MSALFQFLIKLYRYTLSPILGGQCRFHPSCSVYAEHAIAKYGAWEGGWMAIKRLVKCHPWNDGGYDPVP